MAVDNKLKAPRSHSRSIVKWIMQHWWLLLGVIIVLLGLAAFVLLVVIPKTTYDQLLDGRLKDADYWTDTPQILSAGLGFDGIIGLPALDEQAVRDAGGAWDADLKCSNGKTPEAKQRTSAAPSNGIANGFKITPGMKIDHDDGLPIVFSWPVRTDTVDPADFQFTLNTGRVVFPKAAGMIPNWELNERNVVVVFGQLGNRGRPGEPGAEYPVRLDIVSTTTPLTLVGPGGEKSAVGLSSTTDKSPYAVGPTLVGAKLNRVDPTPQGEGGVNFIGQDTLPNDERALYGDEAKFRLRMLTTGGFSPDGIHGVRPNDFEKFFRLRAEGPDGKTVIMDKVGVNYQVMGGTLRILGLSDLGKKEDPAHGIVYDNCYNEDHDNYIDVILTGDEAAARHLTYLELPGLPGGYQAFYNPGGPGPNPFPGVRYTAPSPPLLQPVLIALDNPMRVSR
ncbi:MAG TPA: phospholipase [Chloroflexia bacterium]|nr:phospholipase [Chloroflexia bacterium]